MKYMVEHAQTMFDLFDQFAALAVEMQPLTSTEQKLELLASDARLAREFRPLVSIPELVLAGVAGTEDALGAPHQLIAWRTDYGVRICAQRVCESYDWLAAELAAEERGATLLDPAEGWH